MLLDIETRYYDQPRTFLFRVKIGPQAGEFGQLPKKGSSAPVTSQYHDSNHPWNIAHLISQVSGSSDLTVLPPSISHLVSHNG